MAPVNSLKYFAVLILAQLASNHVIAASVIYAVGDLAGPTTYSYTTTGDWYGGLSADGTTVSGYSQDTVSDAGFRYTVATGIQSLGTIVPTAFPYSNATGVNGDGSVITGVSFNNSSQYEAVRWTSATGMVGIGDLAGGTFNSMGYAVSNDGTVIVGVGNSASGSEAFRWTSGGGMVGLGDLSGGSFRSYAYGVSGDGLVVVGNSISGTSHATRGEAMMWTSGGGIVGLGALAGAPAFAASYAYDASYDGTTIVGYSDSASGYYEAFIWTSGGGMTGLGTIGTNNGSFAFAITDDGSYVVGSYNNNSNAFIWDSVNGMRDLATVLTNDYGVDLSYWTELSEATGVALNGNQLTIAGYGDNQAGTQAFLVTVTIPEPSTYAMLMGGLALAICVAKRKKCRA